MSFSHRMLFNLLIFLGFCALFPSFRTLGSLLGYFFGVAIVEYVSYYLINKD